MGNRNKNKTKSVKTLPKIQSIKPQIDKYNEAFDVYRRHPSIPTIINLMYASLASGAQFSAIEAELGLLTDIDLDQFHGAHGSEYFVINHDALSSFSQYRPEDPNVSAVCELLWNFLCKIKGEDIWGYENYLVGLRDYNYLHEKYSKQEEPPKEVGERVTKSKLSSTMSNLISDMVDAILEKEKAAKQITQEAIKMGFPMVPWAAWVSDLLATRPQLKEGISDLSEYLASYYLSESELDLEKLGFTTESRKLSPEDSRSLARIIAFLIFAPLMKKVIYFEGPFKIENFWEQRIEILSDRDKFQHVEDEAEYLIGISNLLMICSKLDVTSAAIGLATDAELRREFLCDVNAECLDQACLVPIPATGFAQLIIAIDGYEGDRPEEYELADALKVTSYGIQSQYDSDSFEDMFKSAFEGVPPELESVLRTRFENSVSRWNIPVCHTRHLNSYYADFWSDDVIVDKISDALFESDKKFTAATKFLKEELEGVTALGSYLPRGIHPAMFSRRFSNSVESLDFSDREWINFAHSLEQAGQIRFASIVLAMYLTICGIKRFYNLDHLVAIDVRAVIELSKQLSSNDSFAMVRQAIADLFEMYEKVPPLLKGSLKEFLPLPKATLTPLKVNEENRFLQYKNNLIETGFLLTRLSAQTQDFLVKGYTLARDKELAVFNLSSDAVRNYLLGVESELRSRGGDFDNGLAEELKYLGVDIDWKSVDGHQSRRGVFRGLGGICRMLESYSKLSTGAKVKLKGFAGLAGHGEVLKFLESMRELTRIRNSIQHADPPGQIAGSIAGELSRVEQLLFGDGGVVRILCETR